MAKQISNTNKETRRRRSEYGFEHDIAPVEYHFERYRRGEPCFLEHDLTWTIARNLGLPAPDRDKLQKLATAIRTRWGAAQEVPEKYLRLGAPPRRKCALSEPEFMDRLKQVYQQAANLARAMHGTPLLYSIHTGDRRELARQLRSGLFVSQESMDYVADIVEGVAPPRAANRPRRQEDDTRNRTIVWFILRARENGMGDDPSVDAAASEFKLRRRTIQKILSEYKKDEIVLLDETRKLLRQLTDLYQDMK